MNTAEVEPHQIPKAIVNWLCAEFLNQGNLNIADQLFSPDLTGPGGKGPDGFKASILPLLQSFPDLHFTIQDMYTQAVYYESEELKDMGFWKSADGEFSTGPDCKLIVLHMRRLPAGSPMRGKLWIGDFRLSRKPS